MNNVRLIFKGVTEIVGKNELGLLILTDIECKRQLSIICDRKKAIEVELRSKHIPITEDMLPEALCKIINRQSDQIQLELIINDIIDGEYQVQLHNLIDDFTVPINAADAVLLSVAGKIPIYITIPLMCVQSVKYKDNPNGVSIPLNSLSNDMLDQALDKAIHEENYELASQLRDERNRRNTSSNPMSL